MDYDDLSGRALEQLRCEPKRVENPRARTIRKAGHEERNFELRSEASEERTYRLFVRQSTFRPAAFSVGLVLCTPSGGTVLLARYNGGSHAHRNRVERQRLPPGPHRHLTVRRYLDAGLRPDGYAETDGRFVSLAAALRCLIADCGIQGMPSDPDQGMLDI